ncbi:9724_t:CDS:2 [Ambispora gerdemannii]|uniref:9724_t:CDS:1 n=1 Tax=Ambispora gerdemannii TaxID=144530 RepID=A0A9N9F1Z2_9GLOM|nr:9724_t:CDS:2 [Ambispora gerdemannii]
MAPFTSDELKEIADYEVLVKNSKETGLDKPSKVLLQRVKAVEKELRLIDYLGKVDEKIMTKIAKSKKGVKKHNEKIHDQAEKEENQGNSAEIEKLKKELATERSKVQQEKTKSQLEIKRLQNELQQTKKSEEELTEKIKELSGKKVKTQTVSEEKGFWQTIKTLLFYGVGGFINPSYPNLQLGQQPTLGLTAT